MDETANNLPEAAELADTDATATTLNAVVGDIFFA